MSSIPGHLREAQIRSMQRNCNYDFDTQKFCILCLSKSVTPQLKIYWHAIVGFVDSQNSYIHNRCERKYLDNKKIFDLPFCVYRVSQGVSVKLVVSLAEERATDCTVPRASSRTPSLCFPLLTPGALLSPFRPISVELLAPWTNERRGNGRSFARILQPNWEGSYPGQIEWYHFNTKDNC